MAIKAAKVADRLDENPFFKAASKLWAGLIDSKVIKISPSGGLGSKCEKQLLQSGTPSFS